MERTRLPVLVLVGWTLFLWLSRLRNVFADDDLTAAGTAARVAVVIVFSALAGGVVVALRSGRPPLGPTVRVLAGWTVLYWSVRGTAIVVDDHDTGFVVVHAVLMAVSIGVAAWAWTSVGTTTADDRRPARPR